MNCDFFYFMLDLYDLHLCRNFYIKKIEEKFVVFGYHSIYKSEYVFGSYDNLKQAQKRLDQINKKLNLDYSCVNN